MLSRLYKKSVLNQFVVIDSQFPQKEPFAFRNSEINEYISRFKNFSAYTMYPMLPDSDAWFSHGYGMTHEEFTNNKKGYLLHYPYNKKRIRYLRKNKKYGFKLAYSFFLAETYVLLPFFEKNNIPFIFVLYPGGCFGLDNEGSDKMINKICNSKCFKKIIVTQEITRNYLIDKRLCPKNRIEYIYGGFVQFRKEDVKLKKTYSKDKKTFDICFVAAKYSNKGVDKGYDIFIDTAKILAKKCKDVRFHVVGGFTKDDINISEIQNVIKFYGYKKPDFLLDFYSGMDIFLAPNRPSGIFKGNFDGFPLGIDAGFCGVALFVADELHMNNSYKDGDEIVIVGLNARKIAETVINYYNNLDNLYELSNKGQVLTQKLFDIEHQISERVRVFSEFVNLEDSTE